MVKEIFLSVKDVDVYIIVIVSVRRLIGKSIRQFVREYHHENVLYC
jgi:hypothetical protein